MSASDYMCARVDCGKVAIAVRVTSHPTAFYGSCAEHVYPLGEGEDWLHEPPAPIVERLYRELQDATPVSTAPATYDLSSALQHVQALRIKAQHERDAVDLVDCTTARAHALRGRVHALLDVETDLRGYLFANAASTHPVTQ